LVLVISGTRPECIKLAPVIRQLGMHRGLRAVVVNSGQHPRVVERTFEEFGIRCDFALAALPRFSRLAEAYDHLAAELSAVLARVRPELVLVQGDTLTAYAGARVAHQAGYQVGHVEAGLRTDTPRDPFPEEWFRRRIARFSNLHFAPCRSAVDHLVSENIDPAAIHHVGNTGIDSLAWVLDELGHDPLSAPPRERLVLITLHRRENYDRNAEIVCDSLCELAASREDLRMVFPVHPNPCVAEPVRRRLRTLSACALVEPMSYREFIEHAARAALIISDSGGIQEEAPHLGTPLIVPRDNTERPEGVATGFVRLVSVAPGAITRAALDMLAAPRRRALPFDRSAPFGAGDAGALIVEVLRSMLLDRVTA
jgi:UDP-N-acetylglucosamine 2-epimerase (non-hydrolysing)